MQYAQEKLDCIKSFDGDFIQKESEYVENLDVDGKTLLKIDIIDTGWVGMNLIHLAQDSDQWRALVNKIQNYRGCTKCWEIREQVSNWWHLKEGSAPWS
jgi:hypothetical protein